MEELTERQKKLVISKLRELRSNPDLLAKYDKDGDGLVSPVEWDKARRDVVKEVLISEDTRLFTIAPLLAESTQKSPIVIWMYDHRDLVAVMCMLLGMVMIVTDPGTFADRMEAPFEWGENGLKGQLTLVGHWLNWSSSGWAGFIVILFGSIWGELARFFFR